MNHREYTAGEGAPSDIYALAQTPDGTLWIGGANGLTRFDGERFVPYPDSSEEPLLSTNISSLLATPDGALWIGFRPGGASLLKNGHVTKYGEGEGLPIGAVQQFSIDRDGSVWAAARLGLAHFVSKRWEIVNDSTLGTPYGVLVDPAGTLWVATSNGLFARPRGERQFRAVDRREYNSPWGTALVAAPDGGIWAAASRAIIHVDGPTAALRVSQVSGISNIGGPILLDDLGNLWVWDGEAGSLVRLSHSDLESDNLPETRVRPQGFTLADGLNSRRTFALLQDREHNVWVGTNTGLHRFSHSNVVRDIVPTCTEQSLSTTDSFAAGDGGALWIACADSRGAYVEEIGNNVVTRHQMTPIFMIASRDAEGTVWFGGPSALGRVQNERVITLPLPSSLQGRPVQMLVGRGREIWTSMSRRSTYRLLDGVWSENGNFKELPHAWALTGTAARDGVLWLGYTNNRIARVTGHTVSLFGTSDGLKLGNVLSICSEGTRVWVGGDWGLTQFDGKRFVTIRTASGSPFKGVSGIIRARNGDLWLNGTSGIAHISRQEIEWVLQDPSHPVEFETFNYLDGVSGTATHLRNSAIETTDGRLWFSMTAGIISIDPTNLVRNILPPPVTIWALSSALKRYTHLSADLQLPVHTTDIRIEYSAGSLTVPERVRFRYKLEGSDPEWQDVGTRREARYTNLRPGRYTFRVTASNNDGVWNQTGASVDFAILPAFYERYWFYALCGVAFVLALFALYRVRMRQVASQVRGRLEARLTERERIARELHDTLLQGMQGLIWRFQAAAERLPPEQTARQLLEQALDRADSLLGESRDRVKEMRPSAAVVAELPQALAAEGAQFADLHSAGFRVSVDGVRRELHPIVREEGFLIAREALANAFQHASAKMIEVEVIYGERALQLRIRDDGQGIAAAVLHAGGRPGHFGLIGMRERTKKLGGQLEVWSKLGAGTEIDLRVPADVAYRRSQRASRIRARLRILRSSTQRGRRVF